MINILDHLRLHRNRDSTRLNYYTVWKLFNQFVIKLDIMPKTWEDRVYLFMAYLVKLGRKSSTVKSYYSAIKSVLYDINYELLDNQVQLRAIVHSCRLCNDQFHPRFPIKLQLVELILMEIGRMFDKQFFLLTMYRALFAIAYYGMFRIGELTVGDHVLLAKNVHLALNKKKMLFILFSSKTHDASSKPQKVKITALNTDIGNKTINKSSQQKLFCPFELVQNYIRLRGDYKKESEQFFIFCDHSPVSQYVARLTLARALSRLGLNNRNYSFHGVRSGRATNLFNWGIPLETIKSVSRWKSNAIYKYLKQ